MTFKLSTLIGSGELSCNECHHNQSITGFFHGHFRLGWIEEGIQCQKCGLITTRNTSSEDQSWKDGCECGGTFLNTEVLFCPDCKSNQVSYQMDWMT